MTPQEQQGGRSSGTSLRPEPQPGAGLAARTGWQDDPIKTVDQDLLGRASFAEHAARLIRDNHTTGSSVVYGLEGPWGCGKSSVVAMVTAFLTGEDASAVTSDGSQIEVSSGGGQRDHWQVVPFTPWATSGTDALLAEFFSALSTVVPDAGKNRALREKITGYAEIARPIAALIPVVGAGLVEASRTAEDRLRRPWNVAFADVADEIRGLGRPILIVVDDIDRLQPPELLDLLKVVRLLGRFPGVDFLLAYDEQTLIETLQSPARGHVSAARARAFMEKIVQYPLSMPPLLNGKIIRMLNLGLTEILTEERVETTFDKHRFGRVILNTMPSQLTTPRAIERFLAQVREQFLIHDLDEVNDVDLILATFLRVQFPDLFAQLQRWKHELTRGTAGWIRATQDSEDVPDWDKLLVAAGNEQAIEDARSVLEILFPAVSDRNPARTATGRFAHPEYFDRYLAQTIPEGDIPDAVITHALANAARDDSSQLRALLMSEDDERVTLALSKIRIRYPDIGEPWTRGRAPEGPVTLELLASGMRLVDELPDRLTAWTSAQNQTSYWMTDTLRLLLDREPQSNVDPALLECKNATRRAHVLSLAADSLDRVREDTRGALREAMHREAKRILQILLADLRLRDASDDDFRPFLYAFVEKADLLAELRTAVGRGLDAGDFTLEDVAARLVGFAYLVGGPANAGPSSASFSGVLFTKITDVDAESTDMNETGDWPDTGWAARRAFAARYITPPADGSVESEDD